MAVVSVLGVLCFGPMFCAQKMSSNDAPNIESRIRSALRQAERLNPSSVTEATNCLERAVTQVESDESLSESRRNALKLMLKDRIRVMQIPAADPRQPTKAGDEAASLTDRQKVGRLVEGIKRLQSTLGAGDAIPSTGQTTSRITATANQLAASRQLQSQQQRGTTSAIRDIDRTGLPPKDDYSLPKDWKQRTQSRTTGIAALTSREKAMFRALNGSISVRFKNSRLADVIEFAQAATGLKVVLDKPSMEEVGVRYDSPVSVDVKGVSVRTLLRKVAADLSMTYVVRDGAIELVSPTQARSRMVTRTYSVSDLSDSACGSFSAGQAAMFMDLIRSSIEPESWQGNGGDGTIAYDFLTRSVTIKQSAEFHGVLSGGLE
jgi:hypothetical protein